MNATGRTFPLTIDGRGIDTQSGGWNVLDGFSPMPQILTYFEGLNDTNLPHFINISKSLDPDCPTVLVRSSIATNNRFQICVRFMQTTTYLMLIQPL